MRAIALAVLLIGITAIPDVVVAKNVVPPAVLIGVRDGGETILSWSPVPGATGYLVTGGDDPLKMETIAETSAPLYRAGDAASYAYYGVSTQSTHGGISTPHVIGIRGDCVATSTSLQMSISIQGCMNLIP